MLERIGSENVFHPLDVFSEFPVVRLRNFFDILLSVRTVKLADQELEPVTLDDRGSMVAAVVPLAYILLYESDSSQAFVEHSP